MKQAITRKVQSTSSKLVLSFVLVRTSTVFEDSERITNTSGPNSKIHGMKYFQYADIINNFSNLKENWDAYNADTISQIAIATAIETLNQLHYRGLLSSSFLVSVFPMRDGGIQFEFDGKYICAEVEISPNGDIFFILFDNEGDVIDKEQIFELSEIPMLLEQALYA